MKKNWFIFALCFSSTRLWKDMPVICGWLWNPVLGRKQKRQVFYIGRYNSEIWMEICRLNWYVSHPLWSLPPLQSQSGSYHTQMWQISFPRCQKIQGLIVKMKTSLDYSANIEQAFHSVLSHRKQGLEASLISWNKISNCWPNVHCRYKNHK